MEIRAAQMTALFRARKAAFLGRVRQFIADNAQPVPGDDTLAALFDRASAYGLISEQQFAGYILLAWQAGVKPPASDPAWIAEIMEDRSRMPEEKLTTLFDRASLQAERRA
jgi:hypothetical protein